MIGEKEIGISKNHFGFIADEIIEVIPPEWESIVIPDDEGIKKLNCKKYQVLYGVLTTLHHNTLH